MADAYRGLFVEIGGDTTKFTAALRAASSAARSTQADLKAMEKAAKIDPSGITGSVRQMKLLHQQAQDVASKLDTTRKAMRQLGDTKFNGKAVSELAKQTENAALAARKANDEYQSANGKLENMYRDISKVANESEKFTDIYGKNFKINSESFDKVKGTLQELGIVSDETMAKLKELGESHSNALADKQMYDAIAQYEKMGVSVDSLNADLKQTARTMATIKAPSELSKGMTATADKIGAIDTQVKELVANAQRMDSALKVDPGNVEAAQSKLMNLSQAYDLLVEKQRLLQDMVGKYQSAGAADLARQTENVAEAAQRAADNYTQISTAIDHAKGRLTNLKSEQKTFTDDQKSSDSYQKLTHDIQETEAAISRLTAKEREAASSRERYAQASEYQQVTNELKEVQVQAEKTQASIQKIGQSGTGGLNLSTIKTIGMTLSATLTPAMEMVGQYGIQAAKDIDSAYRDMRKTVDGTEQDFESLKKSALDFSRTNVTSADQILSIQAIGGELGLAVEDLDAFSKTVSNLDIATDLNAEEAATSLGQLNNILKIGSDNFDNYGDALVRLGNNGASTESQISEVATRIGSMASLSGMTTPQILALSSTIASTGMKTEAAGTAISNTIGDIENAVSSGGDKLQAFAQVAGQSADQFAQTWQTQPIQAFKDFVQGLKNIEKSGGSASTTLDQLGITGARQKQAIMGLMQTIETLDDNLKMSEDAWKEGGDAAREAQAKNEGFAGSIERLSNNAKNFASELGDAIAPAVDKAADGAAEITKAFSDASDGTKQFIVAMGGIAAAAGPALSIFSTFSGAVKQAMQNSALESGALSGVTAGTEAAATAFQNLSVKQKLASGGMALLKTGANLLKGGLVTLAIAGIGFLIGKFIEWKDKQDNIEAAFKPLSSVLSDASGAAEDYADSLEKIELKGDDAIKGLADLKEEVSNSFEDMFTNEKLVDNYFKTIQDLMNHDLNASEQQRLKDAVDALNQSLGTNYKVVDAAKGQIADETGEIQRNTDEIYKNITAWKSRARAQAYQDASAEFYRKEAESAVDLTEKQAQLNKAIEKEADAREKVQKFSDEHNGKTLTDSEREEYTKLNDELSKAHENTTVLQDDVKKLQDTMSENRKSGDMLSVLNAIESSDLSSNLKQYLTSLDSTAQEAGFNLASALQEGLNNQKFDEGQLTGFVDTVIQAVSGMAPELQQQGLDLANSLAAGLNNGKVPIDKAKDFISTSLSSIGQNLAPEMQDEGMAAAQALGNALSSGAVDVDTAMDLIQKATTGKLDSLAPELQGKGLEALTALSNALNHPEKVNLALSNLMAASDVSFDGLSDEAREAGSKAANALASAIYNGQIDVQAAAQILADAASGNATYDKLPDTLSQKAQDAVVAYANSLADGKGKVDQAKKELTSGSDKIDTTASSNDGKAQGNAYVDGFKSATSGEGGASLSLDSTLQSNLESTTAVAQNSGNNAGQGYTTGFKNGTSTIPATLQGMQTQVDSGIQALKTSAQTAAATIPQGIATGISSGSMFVTAGIASLTAAVNSGIALMAGPAQQSGSQIPQAVATGISSGQGYVTSATASLMSGVNAGLAALSTNVAASGATIPQGIATGISGGAGAVSSATAGLAGSVQAGLQSAVSGAQQAGSLIPQGVAAGVTGGAGAVTAAAASLAQGVQVPLQQAAQIATTAGQQAGQGFAGGISASVGTTAAAAAAHASAVQAMNSNVGAALSWGVHLGSNFAAGIRSQVAAVASASAALAEAAASNIHHTTPKTGPLKDDDKWGGHLADNFAKGIRGGIPKVAQASEALAQAVHDYIGHSQPAKGPLAAGEWVFGYHAALNFAEGIESGKDEVGDAAEDVAEEVEEDLEKIKFEKHVKDMIASYKGGFAKIVDISKDAIDQINNMFRAFDMGGFTKIATANVYDSMTKLKDAGIDSIDDYEKKMEDFESKRKEWDEKRSSGKDFDQSGFDEWKKEYDEFSKMQQSLTASIDEMRHWEPLYNVKKEVNDSIDGSEKILKAFTKIKDQGISVSAEFAEYFADGSEDALKALELLGTVGPEEIQNVSDAMRDMKLAQREVTVAQEEFAQDAAEAMKTPREAMLDFRELVLDVRKGISGGGGLSEALQRAGVSAEGFALKLDAVGMSYSEVASKADSFASKVQTGLDKINSYESISAGDFAENLEYNLAVTQKFSEDAAAALNKIPNMVDRQAFAQMLMEGGPEQFANLVSDMASMSSDAAGKIASDYTKLGQLGYNSFLNVFQQQGGTSPLMTAIATGIQTQQGQLDTQMQASATQANATMQATSPQWYSTGQMVAGQVASGIQSQIGSIASAAAATVQAALAAANAAASSGTTGVVSSSGRGEASLLSARSARSAAPSMARFSAARSRAAQAVNRTTNNSVSMSFTINTQPGQDVNMKTLARQITRIQNREMRARGIR